jgi:hypothetical protein
MTSTAMNRSSTDLLFQYIHSSLEACWGVVIFQTTSCFGLPRRWTAIPCSRIRRSNVRRLILRILAAADALVVSARARSICSFSLTCLFMPDYRRKVKTGHAVFFLQKASTASSAGSMISRSSSLNTERTNLMPSSSAASSE